MKSATNAFATIESTLWRDGPLFKSEMQRAEIRWVETSIGVVVSTPLFVTVYPVTYFRGYPSEVDAAAFALSCVPIIAARSHISL